MVTHGDPPGTLSENGQLRRLMMSSGPVLAIDDDPTIRGLLADLLSLNGYSVITASEGREGIELFCQQHPDLVITDIQMPHMDGLELLRQVRDVDESVPVILVTGHGDLDNALRALRRGAYDFLLKPINPEILLNTVRKGLEHCRLRRFEKNYRKLLEEQVEERTRELAERTKELARTNEFLQGILDSSTSVAIMLTDFENKVLFWNSGAENIYGYSGEEMIGSSVLDLFPADDSTLETLDKMSGLLRHRTGTVQENVKQVAKDGRMLTVSMAVSPMRDASGNVRGILGLGLDVTKEVHLHEELLDSYKMIKKIQGASVFALAKLAESRDGEIACHLECLQQYCHVLCRRLRQRERYRDIMTDQFIEDLVQSSVLHDIGKVGVPDSILFNRDKFGLDEYEVMKQHTIHGGRALAEAAEKVDEGENFLSMGKDVAYYHHERWDGSGYPFGLKGQAIPLSARIVAIADVYDALTTERRYKRAYTHEEAREVIVKEKGKQFDPELVEAFLDVEREFQQIRDWVSKRAARNKGLMPKVKAAFP